MIEINNGEIKKDGSLISLPKDCGSYSATPIVGFDDTEVLRLAKVTNDGKLMVDASLSASGISIGAVSVQAPDISNNVNTIHRTTNDDGTSALYVQDKRLAFSSGKLNVLASGSNGIISTDSSGVVNTNVISLPTPIQIVPVKSSFSPTNYTTNNSLNPILTFDISSYKSKTFVVKNNGTNAADITIVLSIDNGVSYDIFLSNLTTVGAGQTFALDSSMAATHIRILAKSSVIDNHTNLTAKVFALGV